MLTIIFRKELDCEGEGLVEVQVDGASTALQNIISIHSHLKETFSIHEFPGRDRKPIRLVSMGIQGVEVGVSCLELKV
jgi:hypothetical protein